MTVAAASNSFTPDVLNSYSRFKDFFAKTRAIEDIRHQAESLPAKRPETRLLDRWEVAKLTVTTPLEKIYACFIKMVSTLLFSLGVTTWAIQLAVHKRLWEKDSRLLAWQTYGDNCIAFSTNGRAQVSHDVYLQPALSVDRILSERVRALHHPDRREVAFFQDAGCCRGMSEWFFYLYFRTQRYFTDAHAHIQAVGQQFANGAPREAILLQAMHHMNREFLGLRGRGVQVLKASSPEFNHANVVKAFHELKPGAYAINFMDHRMNYISVAPGRGYLFDPNDGTVAIQDTQGFNQLADTVLDYTSPTTPELFSLELLEPL